MHADLRSLLDRMTAKQTATDAAQSVSWQAHRAAEQVAEEAWLDDLDAVLSTSKSRPERRAAGFILGAIGSNTGATRCADILVRGVTHETDKETLASLLDALSKVQLPNGLDLAPVFRLLDDSRWRVRHAAITALKGSSSREAEDQVLAHLARTDDPFDQVYCHATLNRIGTPRAVPQLQLNLASRKRDVKLSADEAIRSIEARHRRDVA